MSRQYEGITSTLGPVPSVPPNKPNPSCFTDLEAAAELCHVMASRTEDVVNRLCGCEVATDQPTNANRVDAGLFSLAYASLQGIREQMERISRALNRLEKQLP